MEFYKYYMRKISQSFHFSVLQLLSWLLVSALSKFSQAAIFPAINTFLGHCLALTLFLYIGFLMYISDKLVLHLSDTSVFKTLWAALSYCLQKDSWRASAYLKITFKFLTWMLHCLSIVSTDIGAWNISTMMSARAVSSLVVQQRVINYITQWWSTVYQWVLSNLLTHGNVLFFNYSLKASFSLSLTSDLLY